MEILQEIKNLHTTPVIKEGFIKAVSALEQLALFQLQEQFPKNAKVTSKDKVFPIYCAADSAIYFIQEALIKLEHAKKHINFIYDNENLLDG